LSGLAIQSGRIWLTTPSTWVEIRACGLQQSRQRVSSEQHSEQIGPEYAGQCAMSSVSNGCSQMAHRIRAWPLQFCRGARAM
jgi:hypothetical protein